MTAFEHEGQWLPEVLSILGRPERWDPQLAIDWDTVRTIYNSYWSPWKPIRFEKSPPHLVRAQQLEKQFSNSYFLITVRNPYAQIEGMLRRQWLPTAESAAEFWVKTARAQIFNISNLKKKLFFRYEDLTSAPDKIIAELIAFIPKLRSLSPEILFTAHNITAEPIQGIKDLNHLKIQNLSQQDLDSINNVLSQHQDVLHYFSYELIITIDPNRATC